MWDDATPRVWLLPNSSRPLGLVFGADRGQADFTFPTGGCRFDVFIRIECIHAAMVVFVERGQAGLIQVAGAGSVACLHV